MSRHRLIAFAAVLLALAELYAGVHWGSTVAGGSDSYGYVSEAGLWGQGHLFTQLELVRDSPWPFAHETWTPLGYRPAADRPDVIVPLYPAGLPLLMALFQAVAGYCGAFLVVPVCGALTVWLTFLLGRRLFDAPGVALAGACLVASSPVFLYQLMNPMSDVPVTAAWTLALVLAAAGQPLSAGLATGAAILIRPNLAPLAVVLLFWLALQDRQLRPDRTREWSLLRAVAGLAPAMAAMAWVNARLYGSPLSTGYSGIGAAYHLSFFVPNLRRYVSWLIDVQTPVVALAGLYLVVPSFFRTPQIAFPRVLLGGTIAIVLLSYLFYQVFGAWWYLRFLLPMWPVLMLLTAAALEGIARRLARTPAPAILAAAVAVLAWHGVRVAVDRSAFKLGVGDRRYLDVARFTASHTAPGAVMFAMQQSGSLRLYSGRLTLRWELLDPAWLDRAVAHLQSSGRHPYFVLDAEEIEAFKTRFAGASALGKLDWRPYATYATPFMAIYDPIERSIAREPLAIAAMSRRSGWRCDLPQNWPPLLRMK